MQYTRRHLDIECNMQKYSDGFEISKTNELATIYSKMLVGPVHNLGLFQLKLYGGR